ncbi:hypothetical protein [Salisediminibacterium beveridgei]|uniref:Uncharacterized protein n=1 Tax=Salisediminibacterium beveridgei TaxID=632773 RepID=A0A1D7QTT9_9BACI|nr:hypothetical protein [Salisediminibacterium beveridgei]AOM82431.1 hypothetical protein BBEV_1062 [Salisediminibacterium beveridgei]
MNWRTIMILMTLIIAAGCANDEGENEAGINDENANETSDQSVNNEQNEEIEELETTVANLEEERDQLLDEISALEAEQPDEDQGEEAETQESPFGENWTPHGDRFYDQVWMYQEQTELEAEVGYERESLDWTAAFGEISEEFNTEYPDLETAEDLVYTWIGERNMLTRPDSFDELTVRMNHTEDNEAEALIMKWGLRDDAIAGEDFLLYLESEDGTWQIRDLEQRIHCRRGTTESDGDVLCQ